MKRLVLFSILMIMVLTGCAKEEALPIVSSRQIITRLEANETLVVVIGQTTCGACIQYKPVLEEMLNNYDFPMAYVELDKDNRNDINELIDNHLLAASATPTTYVFIDGELIVSYVGYMDYRVLKARLEDNGLID